MFALLGTLAYALIAFGLGRSLGYYDPVSLVLLIAALAVMVCATLVHVSDSLDRRGAKLAIVLLAIILVAEQCQSAVWSSFGRLLLSVGLVLTAGLVSVVYLAIPPGRRTVWLFPIVVALFSLPTCVALYTSEAPSIDVWHFQQGASEHLVNGRNPYSQSYPNIYTTDQYYGPRLLENGKIRSFPYPPLSLLLVMPGNLAGDVRWSLWLALVLASVLAITTVRSLGLPAGHSGELAIVAILLYPFNRYLLKESWTESLVAFAVAIVFWAMATRRVHLVWAAAGCVIAIKQYAILILIPFWLSGRLGVRQTLYAGAFALLTALPFLAWDFDGFVWGTLWFHVHNIFRSDALSIPAFLNSKTQWEISTWVPFVLSGVVGLITNLRTRGSLAEAAMSAAAILLVFFLFNKAAFFNYYWLVLFLVALAIILNVSEIEQGETIVKAETHPW